MSENDRQSAATSQSRDEELEDYSLERANVIVGSVAVAVTVAVVYGIGRVAAEVLSGTDANSAIGHLVNGLSLVLMAAFGLMFAVGVVMVGLSIVNALGEYIRKKWGDYRV